MLFILIGALVVIGGVVYMAKAAAFRGKLSDPAPQSSDTADRTLEPRHKGSTSSASRRTGLGP